MMRKLRWLAMIAAVCSVSACYYPYPYAVATPSLQERYDRSWAAASGAMYDQGLAVTQQDRSTGVIRGERGGTVIMATLQTTPDGSVQVKFDSRDASLVDRVTDSYNRRMGR